MLVDVLKFAWRPLAVAAILILLALKGFTALHFGLRSESEAPPGTASSRPAAASVQPQARPAYGSGPITLNGDRAGQFQADVVIDGSTLRMLVDTGASAVTLTAEDADRLGIHPFPNDYTLRITTANGVAMAAQTELREISLGDIHVRGVTAIVLPRGASRISLLGMTFLQRLSSFQVSDNRLLLKP
ncbi:aspartyl protease family protein [Rhizobiales bacterium GAS113]|jgi:aspartyl protease family protein|nr:aspartyl protease family protein [Rhizobiales bacterium GAS113]SED41833.1 aspartyl protease family protein [Rhizobiales bacterium GAS188]